MYVNVIKMLQSFEQSSGG